MGVGGLLPLSPLKSVYKLFWGTLLKPWEVKSPDPCSQTLHFDHQASRSRPWPQNLNPKSGPETKPMPWTEIQVNPGPRTLVLSLHPHLHPQVQILLSKLLNNQGPGGGTGGGAEAEAGEPGGPETAHLNSGSALASALSSAAASLSHANGWPTVGGWLGSTGCGWLAG